MHRNELGNEKLADGRQTSGCNLLARDGGDAVEGEADIQLLVGRQVLLNSSEQQLEELARLCHQHRNKQVTLRNTGRAVIRTANAPLREKVRPTSEN